MDSTIGRQWLPRPVLDSGDRDGSSISEPLCADRESREPATAFAIATLVLVSPSRHRITIQEFSTHDLAFPAPPPDQPSPGSALKSRARLTKQHRRMATLETLESRVVLSNVTTSLAGNVLTITGDRFNDSFKIAEVRRLDGTHVTVTATDTHTNINGIPYNSGILSVLDLSQRGRLHQGEFAVRRLGRPRQYRTVRPGR